MEPARIPKLIPPRRILVVDDEPGVADMIRMIMVMWGHEVEIAGSGARALALFEVGKYDLVATDFTMPGMDGLELARIIKERSPGQPIIMITAYAGLITDHRRSNVSHVLGKPFQVEELAAILDKVFTPAPV